MNTSKPILCLLAATILLPSLCNAATFRYRASGVWTDVDTTGSEVGWRLNNGTADQGIPGAGDDARINWGDNTVTVTDNVPTFGRLQIGVDESGTVVVANGGVLTTTNNILAGNNNANATGTLTVQSGGMVNVGNISYAGHTASTGFINIEDGGVMTVASHLWWASSTSNATIQIAGTVTQTGGILGLGTSNAIDPSGGSATVNIFGNGRLNLNNIHGGLTSIQPGSVVNLTGNGQLTLPGDFVSTLTSYVEIDRITGNGMTGLENVIIDFDSVQDITTLTAIPEPATAVLLLGLAAGAYCVRRRRRL